MFAQTGRPYPWHGMRAIHTFDNGVKVYDDHLLPIQRDRYRVHNVHESEEEELFIRIIRALTPGETFLNIGAAIGYYPLLARRLSGSLHIHAVEALPRHRSLFLENIRLNAHTPEEFTIHPEAIAAGNGHAELMDRSFGSGLLARGSGPEERSMRGKIKALLHGWGIRRDPRRITVPTLTLDSLLERLPDRRAGLCQMDVQGFEVDVLTSGSTAMREARIGSFLIGTHSARLHAQCIELLRHYSYSIDFDEQDTQTQPDGIIVASKGRDLGALSAIQG